MVGGYFTLYKTLNIVHEFVLHFNMEFVQNFYFYFLVLKLFFFNVIASFIGQIKDN